MSEFAGRFKSRGARANGLRLRSLGHRASLARVWSFDSYCSKGLLGHQFFEVAKRHSSPRRSRLPEGDSSCLLALLCRCDALRSHVIRNHEFNIERAGISNGLAELTSLGWVNDSLAFLTAHHHVNNHGRSSSGCLGQSVYV